MNFSAVILAGGRSSRMGCDKAWLPVGGQPLLARQIELARELGPAEIFISGRGDTDYGSFGCPVLGDRFPDAGPLAGIERALHETSAALVLVLAVDMPQMTSRLLQRMLAECAADSGVVPRVGQHIEPLAAVYPKAAQPIAADLLGRGLQAVRTFAEKCKQSRMVAFRDMEAGELRCFANWNAPDDLPSRLAADAHASQAHRPECLRAALARA